MKDRPNHFQIASVTFQDIKGDWWRLRNLLAEPGPRLEPIRRNPKNRWWNRSFRKVAGSGQTSFEKTFIRQIDDAVAKIKPVIEAENAQASLEFREGLKKDGF